MVSNKTLIIMCVKSKELNHGVHGVSQRNKRLSYQNSVVLRDLRGYILHIFILFIRIKHGS